MGNVKAAMEYAQTFEREAMEKRLSESDLEAPTLIDVVVKHEQEIQELKRLVMPTKICGPNLVGILNAAGFYQKTEWVGLTDEEITEIRLKTFDAVATNYEVYRAIEAKLKEKNNGND